MPKYTFMVLTNPVEGQEDIYNDWYNNRHLADVLKVPVFVSAQRFKLCPTHSCRSGRIPGAILDFVSDRGPLLI